MVSPWIWVAFHAVIMVMLAVDLGLGRRSSNARAHWTWSGVWIAVGLAFGAFVYWRFGSEAGAEYFAAYLLEKSLSVDNLFVFVLIFGALGIQPEHRHRVLFWGVLGALVMRGAMIVAGAALVARFDWVLYLFGAFLILTGWRMYAQPQQHVPEVGPVLRLMSRIVPIEPGDRSGRFLIRRPGRLLPVSGTPLLVALALVETTDLAFAVDSIPAVFAVTRDPFIVYTSNVMAVLGLRALFFVVAEGLQRVRYLRQGLATILVFVGTKMLIADWWHVPISVSLAVIGTILAAALAASLRTSRSSRRKEPVDAGQELPTSTSRPQYRRGGNDDPSDAAEQTRRGVQQSAHKADAARRSLGGSKEDVLRRRPRGAPRESRSSDHGGGFGGGAGGGDHVVEIPPETPPYPPPPPPQRGDVKQGLTAAAVLGEQHARSHLAPRSAGAAQ